MTPKRRKSRRKRRAKQRETKREDCALAKQAAKILADTTDPVVPFDGDDQ